MSIMDLSKLSESVIKLLYNAIYDALSNKNKIYGIRKYSDFKEFSDSLELIINNHNISYQKIDR